MSYELLCDLNIEGDMQSINVAVFVVSDEVVKSQKNLIVGSCGSYETRIVAFNLKKLISDRFCGEQSRTDAHFASKRIGNKRGNIKVADYATAVVLNLSDQIACSV